MTSPKNKGDFFTVKSNLGRIHITHLLKDAIIKKKDTPRSKTCTIPENPEEKE